LDVRTLPGHEEDGGTFVSSTVALHGIWQSDGIRVTSFETIEFEGIPTAPCSPPQGGWPGVGTEDDRYWNERRLGDYLGKRSDTFASWWVARTSVEPEPFDVTHRVLVVGTKLDPESVIEDLREVFPANLCVERVEFSADDLYAPIRELLGPDPPWNRDWDERRNRVIIRPLLMDEEFIATLNEKLAPYLDRIIVEPAVRLER
jgi:hypothetical protein